MAVVAVTRNRISDLLTALGHLEALPERPKIVSAVRAEQAGVNAGREPDPRRV